MKNLWEDSDAFLMALRLRKKGIYLPDVEALFANIVIAIVKMSTILLLKNEPEFKYRKELFLSPETQASMLVPALEALSKADLRRKPRPIINLVTKAVQNRLKNLSRDVGRAERRGITVTEQELGVSMEYMPYHCDLYGQRRRKYSVGKVNTQNFDD